MSPDQRDPAGRLPGAFTSPGSSSFTDFLSAHAPTMLPAGRALPPGTVPDTPHGTTIVAVEFDGGVVMGGDRRATMGSMIANREIEKVFGADEYSCVGIAGSAGLAIELVKLFQVELEHYEKIEGTLLSMEGKANRLATMLRNNLGLAMQGLAVVPLFAGYDVDDRQGRIYSYDVTGGCYREHHHHSVGSGSLFARGALKKMWRPGLASRPGGAVRRRGALRRRGRRLGDRWSGPQPADLAGRRRRRRRGVPPGGRRHARRSRRAGGRGSPGRPRRSQGGRRGLPARGGERAMSMPFYVSPEQLMKDRADYARKGIARGRSAVVLGYDGGIAFVAENTSRALHKVSEIYDRVAFAAVGKYNEFENLRVAGVRYADLRGYSYDRSDVTARGLANAYAQTLGTVFTQESKPYEVEIVVAEVAQRPEATRSTGSPTTGRWRTSTASSRWAVSRRRSTPGSRSAGGRPHAQRGVLAGRRAARGRPGRRGASRAGPEVIEAAVLDRQRERRLFRRITGELLERLLSPSDPTSDVPHADERRVRRLD